MADPSVNAVPDATCLLQLMAWTELIYETSEETVSQRFMNCAVSSLLYDTDHPSAHSTHLELVGTTFEAQIFCINAVNKIHIFLFQPNTEKPLTLGRCSSKLEPKVERVVDTRLSHRLTQT